MINDITASGQSQCRKRFKMFNKMESSREIASTRRTIGICSVFSRRFPGKFFERNVKKALQVLDELLASKEAIQKIFIIIANHYMKLIVTKELMERSQDVAKYLEIKEYPASKYKEQASKFTKSELITIYKKLAKLDIDSKLSKIDLKLGLQKIIME